MTALAATFAPALRLPSVRIARPRPPLDAGRVLAGFAATLAHALPAAWLAWVAIG